MTRIEFIPDDTPGTIGQGKVLLNGKPLDDVSEFTFHQGAGKIGVATLKVLLLRPCTGATDQALKGDGCGELKQGEHYSEADTAPISVDAQVNWIVRTLLFDDIADARVFRVEVVADGEWRVIRDPIEEAKKVEDDARTEKILAEIKAERASPDASENAA